MQEKYPSVACRVHPESGRNPQPRHVPWLGIKSVTLHFFGTPNQLSHIGQGSSFFKRNLIFLKKNAVWPRNSTTRYLPKRNENVCSHKDLYINVHSSTIHNSQKLGTPKCPSTDEWINKMCYWRVKDFSFIIVDRLKWVMHVESCCPRTWNAHPMWLQEVDKQFNLCALEVWKHWRR